LSARPPIRTPLRDHSALLRVSNATTSLTPTTGRASESCAIEPYGFPNCDIDCAKTPPGAARTADSTSKENARLSLRLVANMRTEIPVLVELELTGIIGHGQA